jgi:hypothetical protein
MRGRDAVNLKTALLAVTAAAALIGAAIIGVPSSSDRSGDALLAIEQPE